MTIDLISTHTPAWGVTAAGCPFAGHPQNFNSHARVGRDSRVLADCTKATNFNSHARVGRDTVITIENYDRYHFNSHARVGRDKVYRITDEAWEISTHTPAWGVTCDTGGALEYYCRFQLTRPRGA